MSAAVAESTAKLLRKARYRALTKLAAWSLWRLWWGHRDDPDHQHTMRHVLAALEAGCETTCGDGRCALDEGRRR